MRVAKRTEKRSERHTAPNTKPAPRHQQEHPAPPQDRKRSDLAALAEESRTFPKRRRAAVLRAREEPGKLTWREIAALLDMTEAGLRKGDEHRPLRAVEHLAIMTTTDRRAEALKAATLRTTLTSPAGLHEGVGCEAGHANPRAKAPARATCGHVNNVSRSIYVKELLERTTWRRSISYSDLGLINDQRHQIPPAAPPNTPSSATKYPQQRHQIPPAHGVLHSSGLGVFGGARAGYPQGEVCQRLASMLHAARLQVARGAFRASPKCPECTQICAKIGQRFGPTELSLLGPVERY